VSLLAFKQQLSDLTKRKAQLEVRIEQEERANKERIDSLRTVFGARVTDDPTTIPFEELAKETEARWETLSTEIDNTVTKCTEALTELEKDYDEAYGSATSS
jgi:hypothetical protein